MNGWIGFGFVLRRLIFNSAISKDEDDEGLQSNQRCVIVCNGRRADLEASKLSIDQSNQSEVRIKQALEENQKQAIGSELLIVEETVPILC